MYKFKKVARIYFDKMRQYIIIKSDKNRREEK